MMESRRGGTVVEPINKGGYRHDLDGLRGIAIALVVVFHVFVGRVSGGVDVFLLLSGFFFVASQTRYADKPEASFNPWWPIWRTLRRLVPSLVLVIAVMVVLIVAFIPQLKRLNIGEQVVSSVLYYQNWALPLQGEAYGAASQEISPFQHLWSMSVQGQFYLGGILLILALGALTHLIRRADAAAKFKLSYLLTPVLIVITVASFLYAMRMQADNQVLNYYSTFSRLWELTLGGLLGLWAAKVRLPEKLRGLATVVGVLMVAVTGFLFDGVEVFPGPETLFPLGGAVLVIFGGGFAGRVLSGGLASWLGRIAYALYLWHWPLLILATVVSGQPEPSVPIGLAVVAASLLLADLTHRFIEEPLRQHASRPKRGEHRAKKAWSDLHHQGDAQFRSVGGILVTATALALLTVPSGWRADVSLESAEYLDPQLYPGAAALRGTPVPDAPLRPSPWTVGDTSTPIFDRGCISMATDDPDEDVFDRGDDPENCVFGDREADFSIMLIGGSHAEQWITPLHDLGVRYGFKIYPIIRQGCPAYIDDKNLTSDEEIFSDGCTEFNSHLPDRFEEFDPDLVFSTSTRPEPYGENGHRDAAPDLYVRLWEYLEKEGYPFFGVRDNPWFIDDLGEGYEPTQCIAEGFDAQHCGINRDEFYASVDPAHRYMESHEDTWMVDTSSWFCSDGFCPPHIGNIFPYRDSNHLTEAYMHTVSPMLWMELRPAIDELTPGSQQR